MCEERPRIVPAVYTGPGIYGDFEWMIHNRLYDDSLFILNDNVLDRRTAYRGRGNAVIRPYNKYGAYKGYPRSAGIPTGYSRRSGGYSSLTPAAQKEIDKAVDEIRELIEEYEYCRLFFSADPAVGTQLPQLGTSIFSIGDDVRTYITRAIYSLGYYEPTED